MSPVRLTYGKKDFNLALHCIEHFLYNESKIKTLPFIVADYNKRNIVIMLTDNII